MSASIKIYSKTDFSRKSHYKETSNFICIANHLTGFLIIQVSTERNFRSELKLQNTCNTCTKRVINIQTVKYLTNKAIISEAFREY